MTEAATLAWTKSRTAEALAALARVSRLPVMPRDNTGVSDVMHAASRLGLEAVAIGAAYADVDVALRSAGPALVKLDDDAIVVLVGARARSVVVVAPDRSVRTIKRASLRNALCAPPEHAVLAEVDATIDEAGVPARRRRRARTILLRERLAGRRVEIGWILRPAPGAPIRAHANWSHFARQLGLIGSAHAVQYALGILGWWSIGKGALEGRIDRGWVLAWALVLFSQIPFRLLVSWLQGVFAVDAGALLKQRLLAGTLELESDAIRGEGAGHLLGRILESESIESLALNAGFVGLIAIVELCLAGAVLALGAGGALHVASLMGAIALTLAIGWTYHRKRRAWTSARLGLTHQLVEHMVGHRTRLAQQSPERWHDGEDDALDRYLAMAGQMDGEAAKLTAVVPRAWMFIGVLGLAPAFTMGTASRESLAVALGGVILAFRALRKLVSGAASLSGAVIAWKTIGTVFRAAASAEVPVGPDPSRTRERPDPAQPIVDASELVFRYGDRAEPVLRGCALRVYAGDRLLLEGSSGSGKSTFGAILAGLRDPESGFLLLDGFDKKTLGLARWRKRIAIAPQFHENHVFSSSFAFNLLMGRGWPPAPEDLLDAEGVCRELDLGPLIERMPAGLLQMVGETGWQLSHGEKSRVFLARALLQDCDVILLDESFAALDPHTQRRSVACAMARANALLVIGHR